MNDTWLHIMLAGLGWTVGGVFTAGGFYIYVRMSINNLTEDIRDIQKRDEERARDVHDRLNGKVDRNYQALDEKMDMYHKEIMIDLAGIGSKAKMLEKDSWRRYHHTSLAIQQISPTEKEPGISHLLREDS